MRIKIENLFFKYDEYLDDNKYILNNINVQIDNNDYVSIIGETGSGKSTLVQHLNGLLIPNEGKILIDDENIYDKNYNLNLLRFKIGLVFQYPEYQFFAENVLDEVSFGAKNMGYSEEEANEKSKTVLNKFGIKQDLYNKMPFLLSGGEKRKIAIASVLVMDPEVLIMDEPQAGLDPISKEELFNILDELHNEGKTIIIVTHNLEDVIERTNKVIIMSDGQILKTTTPYELFSDDDLLKKANIVKPEQIEFVEKIYKKYNSFDKSKIKIDEIVNEVIKIKNNNNNK